MEPQPGSPAKGRSQPAAPYRVAEFPSRDRDFEVLKVRQLARERDWEGVRARYDGELREYAEVLDHLIVEYGIVPWAESADHYFANLERAILNPALYELATDDIHKRMRRLRAFGGLEIQIEADKLAEQLQLRDDVLRRVELLQELR